MRNILLAFACLAILSAIGCKKKDHTPEEYFSFDANGVHYHYPQEKGTSFVGNWKTLGAGPTSGSLGYIIRGHSTKNYGADGDFTFTLYDGFPAKDTIILGVDGYVTVYRFINQSAYYSMIPPYGRIVFTERTSEKLTGTFEFSVELYNFPTFGPAVDTVMHITNGKFSIIPSKN